MSYFTIVYYQKLGQYSEKFPLFGDFIFFFYSITNQSDLITNNPKLN